MTFRTGFLQGRILFFLNLFGKHFNASVQPGNFQFRFVQRFIHRLLVLQYLIHSYIHEVGIGKTVDNLLFILVGRRKKVLILVSGKKEVVIEFVFGNAQFFKDIPVIGIYTGTYRFISGYKFALPLNQALHHGTAFT